MQNVGVASKGKQNFLDYVAKGANKLPHPVTIFIIFSVIVAIASELCARSGLTITFTSMKGGVETLEEVRVRGLLNGEGIRWIFGSAIDNFKNFHPLGVVLVFSLFFNFLNEVGLFPSFLKKSLEKIPARALPYFVAFLGVNSSFAGDLGYVLVIPVAAILYKAVGRNPLAGILLGFSATSAGFSACLLSIDALLGGLSTEAIKTVDSSYVVNPLANSIFMFVFTFFVTAVVTVVNNRIVEPKLARYEIEDSQGEEDMTEPLTGDESRGLKFAGWGFVVSIGLIALLSIPEGAPLRHPVTGKLLMGWSPLLSSIVPVFCFIFFIPGLFYGIGAKRLRSDKDLMEMLFKSVNGFGAFIVLCFFAAQFIAWFTYTELGKVIAVKGGQFLSEVGLKGIPLLIAFILFCAFANLFMGSMSSKYALLAPIFLPILYNMGISPELAQLAYRLGDSATNVISPLMSYFALMLVYCGRYSKKFGMGDIITFMIPHSMAILFSSIIFLVVWIMLNLPIGIGTVNFL